MTNLHEYSEMWTEPGWWLCRTGNSYVPMQRIGDTDHALIIEDDDVAAQVYDRMLAGGTPVGVVSLDEVRAWVEQGSSIHLRAADPQGDPIELTGAQAREVAAVLGQLADNLDAREQAT